MPILRRRYLCSTLLEWCIKISYNRLVSYLNFHQVIIARTNYKTRPLWYQEVISNYVLSFLCINLVLDNLQENVLPTILNRVMPSWYICNAETAVSCGTYFTPWPRRHFSTDTEFEMLFSKLDGFLVNSRDNLIFQKSRLVLNLVSINNQDQDQTCQGQNCWYQNLPRLLANSFRHKNFFGRGNLL